MEAFKFLNLPAIPQSMVFRIMSDQERLDAALMSKRILRMIRADPKTRANYQLAICFVSHQIYVRGVRAYCTMPLLEGEKYNKTYMLDGEKVPTEDKKSSERGCRPDDRVLYFDKNKLDEGFKKMYLYLLRKLEITTVCHLNGMMNTVLPLRRKLKKRSVAVKGVLISDKDMSTEQAETIFSPRFFQDLNTFHCYATPPKNFIAQRFPEYISMQVLMMSDSQWFTINHLLTCKWAENIDLKNSSLTSIDMKIFMSEWKNGKYGNLASITIRTAGRNKLIFDAISGDLADQERGVAITNGEANFLMTNIQGHEAQVWVSDHQFRCKVVITIE